MLLVGASLLGRSFVALIHADRGYDPYRRVVGAACRCRRRCIPQRSGGSPSSNRCSRRLAAMPGVTDAAFTSELPLTPGGSTSAFNLKSLKADGGIVRSRRRRESSARGISPRCGFAIIAGRIFSDDDTETSEPVVVVNRAFARRYLGDSPLGARVPMVAYAAPDGEMVRVDGHRRRGHVRYVTAGDSAQPEMYYSHRQMGGRLPVQTITLLTRSSGDPGAAATALRRGGSRSGRAPGRRRGDAARAAAADDAGAAADVCGAARRLRRRLRRSSRRSACSACLSYSVSLRSRELAIRSALGATPGDMLRLVLRQGLTVTIAGVAVGTIASAWLAGALSTQLYGVTPHDTVTFVGSRCCFWSSGRWRA